MERLLRTAVVVLIVAAHASAKIELECKGEGLVANHTTSCRDYYRCRAGTVSGTYSCPEGLAFNEAARQCLPKGRVSCVKHVCDPEDTSYYTSPGTQCQYYYKCERGTPLELACPVGSWFDFRRQECTRSAGVCYEPVCTGHTDGKYPDSTQACRRALICTGGTLVAVESPGPLNEDTCPSPRATAVAFPITGGDSCATLADGAHPSPGSCKEYVVCKDGETQATMRCPDRFRFDGERCSPEEVTSCADECADREDGFHIDLASGCRDYFYCQNGSSVLRTSCADGNVFDGQMCVSPAFHNCPSTLRENLCLKRADGYHRDFRDCSSYVYCEYEAIKFRGACLGGQVWNGSNCVDPGEFACRGPFTWSGCTERHSGYHQDRSRGSDCRDYFHCKRDQRMSFSCPAGEVFNGDECIAQRLYTCPSLEKDSCEFKSDGYYQQTNGDCRAYYLCSGGNKIIYLCSPEQVFDGDKCVDRDTYRCPYQSKDCVGKSNGYHQDPSADCRKYYFCESGAKLTTLQCSGSKVFNGRGCVAAKEYRCPSAAGCALRTDGYHMAEGTKCRQYFECRSGVEVARRNCPVDQVYDGRGGCATRNCSISQVVTCERNGFFLDPPSRCNSYHVCVDKRKTTLRCDRNMVFDGQLCVPKDAFHCPDECQCNHR